MKLQKGNTFYDTDNYKCHIVERIIEKPYNLIVYKYFGKNKKRWFYFVELEFVILNSFDCGLYTEKKKDK